MDLLLASRRSFVRTFGDWFWDLLGFRPLVMILSDRDNLYDNDSLRAVPQYYREVVMGATVGRLSGVILKAARSGTFTAVVFGWRVPREAPLSRWLSELSCYPNFLDHTSCNFNFYINYGNWEHLSWEL